MKRGAATSNSSSSSSDGPEAKRRKVKYETYKQWIAEYDRDYQTASWLDCEVEASGGKRYVMKLKCRICHKYNTSIIGRRNFSEKWIEGAESVCTTNLRNHSKSDQHVHAMNLHKRALAKSSGQSASMYAPIARALNVMSDDEQKIMRNIFDIAYFVATEQLTFRKYPKLCELEDKHSVRLGTAYRNVAACKEFVHYVAESSRQQLNTMVSGAHFFSLLMDGSTDYSNHDNELILVQWCDISSPDEKVQSRVNFLTVYQPDSVNAEGIFASLEYGLHCLGIPSLSKETCQQLVGIATDGASANISSGGLKGLVEKELSWMYWMWCLAHRLELAIKDALNGSFFDAIDELLLHLYYLYEKSPKKCQELEIMVSDLGECFKFDDNGVKPLRASGSRWVSYKLNAMKRILSKYGAYVAHTTQLSEDRTVKSTDRAKLKGYLKKWINAKYVLGCALFIDLLYLCSIFSKAMQSDSLDIVGALTCLISTVKETEKLKSRPLSQWPTYSTTMKKIDCTKGEPVYQCQALTHFVDAKGYFETNYERYCAKIIDCIQNHLEWSDMHLFRDIIVMLATQGWQKLVDRQTTSSLSPQENKDGENPLNAVNRLVEHFKIPLENAGADIGEIHGEFEALISYAAQFMSLSTMDYKSVLWQLFHAPTSSEWANALTLAKQLFSLPVSNGKVERIFSQLNLIKTNRRATLAMQSLQDLVLLNTEKVEVKDYDPHQAIELWWEAKQRRPQQRKINRLRTETSGSSTLRETTTHDSDTEQEVEPESFLDDWDFYFQ